MKRYKVLIEESAVDALREMARRKAVALHTDISWVGCLRDAVDRYLEAEGAARPDGRPVAVTNGGGR